MDWLPKEDYLPYAPDGAGETEHIHHCRDGKDNDKLFITRCEDGYTIIAYCHHCGKRGFANTSESATISTLKKHYSHKRSATTSSSGYEYKLPNDCEGNPSKWDRRARVWVRRYGITNEEIEDYGIAYSPSDTRVVLPVYDSDGLALYQTRKLLEEDTRPKYLTYNNRHGSLWYSHPPHISNSIVLCEDVISGIRLGRHLPAGALLGTSISDRVLNAITNVYDTFIIFMDDDNTDVRMKQLVLKNRLELFGDVNIVHTNGRDAKEHTDAELKEILL